MFGTRIAADKSNERVKAQRLADNHPRITRILEVLTEWVRSQPDIRAAALVGSHARDEALPDSDVDLVFLSRNPDRLRDTAWLLSVGWSHAGVQLTKWADEEYGAVWSRRAWFNPECELELTFAPLSWADVSPVDQGTARVVSSGCRILHDPDGLLKRLKETVATLFRPQQSL
jgi:Nucleotidyltransferase domain